MIRIDIDNVNQVRRRFKLHYQATKIRIAALQVRNDQLIRRLQSLREEYARLKKRLYDKYQAIELKEDESTYNPGIPPEKAVVDNSFVSLLARYRASKETNATTLVATTKAGQISNRNVTF